MNFAEKETKNVYIYFNYMTLTQNVRILNFILHVSLDIIIQKWQI